MRSGAEYALWLGILLLPWQWVPALPLPVVKLSDVAFAVAFAATVLSRPDLRGVPRSALAALALFLAGAAASALAAGGSYLRLLGHAELVLVAATCAILARDSDTARRLRTAIVLAATCAAVAGLVGVVLFYAGEMTPLVNIQSGDLVPGAYPRVRGVCGRPNMLASVLAVGIILLSSEPDLMPSQRLRRAALAVMFAALPFTFSRTIVALGLALFALLVLQRPTPSRVRWLAGAAVLVVGLLLVSVRWQILIDPTEPWDIWLTGEPGTRWNHWRGALQTAFENPIFGLGPGRSADLLWSAHNAWLNIWATLGLVPVLAFAFLYARVMRLELVKEASGVGLALAILLVDSITTDVEDMRHLWVLFGLMLATAASLAARRTPGASVDQPALP